MISPYVLYVYDTMATACAFLDLMDKGRTLMLQDVAQLINIGCNHILL